MDQNKTITLSTYFVYFLFGLMIVNALATPVFRVPANDFTTPMANAGVRIEKDDLDTAFRLFDGRAERYVAVSSDIRTMLYGMIVIAGISIFATITRPQRFKMPLLDLEADATWLRWACPGILICLWLYFGYEFYSAIVSRTFLIDLGRVIENNIDHTLTQSEPLKRTIEDNSIGDFIFYLLHPTYQAS